MIRTLFIALLLLCAFPAVASRHVRQPKPQRVFVPSHQNLVEQNAEVVRLGLQRFADNRAMDAAIERGELVAFTPSPAITFDKHLPENRRYARPWVVAFIERLAADFYAQFGTPLKVNSAARSVQFQQRLRRWNANAAPARGDIASVHTAGLAVDLQRRGLSRAQLRYIQIRLLAATTRAQVIVEEEIRRNTCIHVVVRFPNFDAIAIPPLDTPVPNTELSFAGTRDFPLD